MEDTKKILLKMNISSNLWGYHYILASVEMLRKQKIHTNIITIYDEVAKKYDKPKSSVERAIRFSIETAWERKTILTRIYSYKPSNASFLYDIAFNENIFIKEGE